MRSVHVSRPVIDVASQVGPTAVYRERRQSHRCMSTHAIRCVRRGATAIVVSLLTTVAAGAQPVASSAPAFNGDPVHDTLAARLHSAQWAPALSAGQRRLVAALYDAAGGMPLWMDGTRLNARARALAVALADAPRDGLNIEAYPLDSLQAALAMLAGSVASGIPQRATVDLLLTAAYARLGEDLLTGQVDPRSVAQAWHIDDQRVNVDSALIRALRTEPFDAGLARLRPHDAAYDALRDALAHYRVLAREPDPPPLTAGLVLRPGDTTTAERLSPIVERLRREGFVDQSYRMRVLPPDPDSSARASGVEASRVSYDDLLATAVGRYQARHGLVVDSVVGPRTRAALHRTMEYRARQIAANLERHRWLPRSLGDRFVLVNVPAFRLAAFDSGREVLSMKVIVGAEYDDRATPVFSDSMSYVVFRPYWNVPRGIAARELWPRQRREPGFFRREGYEVAEVSWGSYVRQRPGPTNALGLVKFIFPNDFAIYLHDTPADALFDEAVRAFSHGCIRVERPEALAQYVLGWERARVEDAMLRGPDDQRVYLERKLPVYIVYFTVHLRDGELRFANDIYDRDDALVRAMHGAVFPSERVLAVSADIRELVQRLAGD